jgi:hypothetical protein
VTHLRFPSRPGARIVFLALVVFGIVSPAHATENSVSFRRIASLPVFFNTCAGVADFEACANQTTIAEIVAASGDGKTLVYTDAATRKIGFIDISNPANPRPGGTLDMGGEPTSVAVLGDLALVAVDTSVSFVQPSGWLRVVNIPARWVVTSIELGGQPDSVAISPNKHYAAIAIENERNEELCVGGTLNGQEVDEDECEDGGGVLGGLPQMPAGFMVIIDLAGQPASWRKRTVSLTGIADKFPEDPEPEYVDINEFNVAAVTLQENNHIVLVYLPTGQILHDFSAGTVNLSRIDTEDNSLIEMNGQLGNVPREPDAVTWISPLDLATADEGDLDGGSRGFTIFWATGHPRFRSGNEIERLVTRIGHYPDGRSDAKGNEPEGIVFARYGPFQRFLFVGSERASVVAVYDVPLIGDPKLMQVLPAGTAPEGLLALPDRDLFVTTSEEDSRADAVRSVISIYKLVRGEPAYPTVVSENRPDGLPIPWGALSALAAHPRNAGRAYTVYDSFYEKSRIFTMDVSRKPARITGEIVMKTPSGATVNYDLEGLATRTRGEGFWAVSEGAGNAPAAASANLLIEVAEDGTVREIPLPASVNALQRSMGFEGVAAVGTPGIDELVYVAFQRPWAGDPANQVRIGRFNPRAAAGQEWTFFYYPLDVPTSPNGGTVGLSELVATGHDTFAVIERDNQAGPDARIKKIYSFSIAGLIPQPQGGVFPLVTKTLVRDLMPILQAPNGLVIEKVEGLTVLANGDAIIVTDNDGVDGTNGETQFLNLGRIF